MVKRRPSVVLDGTGLRAFFAGLSAGDPLDSQMATATSADGNAWTVQPTPASNDGASESPVYAAAGIAALGTPTGFLSIWGDSSPQGGGYTQPERKLKVKK